MDTPMMQSSPASRPALRCYTPPHDGWAHVDGFGELVSRYRQTVRWHGNYWSARWEMRPGDARKGMDISYLRHWFKERLGYGIVALWGGAICWRGIVWEMRLTDDGLTERVQLETVYNRVKVAYTRTIGVPDETTWVEDTSSQAKYGIREIVVPAASVTPTVAQAAAEAELAASLDAEPELVGVSEDAEDVLAVTAVGVVMTANNRYVTASAGSTFSDYITNIIADDCQVLSAGDIQTNALESTAIDIDARAWDTMYEMILNGDSAGAAWRLWCDQNDLLHYTVADNTPTLKWGGRKHGGLSDSGGERNPWLFKPGVMRNLTRPYSLPLPGSFMQQGNDSWVDEITMYEGASIPTLSTGYTPAAILKITEQHARMEAKSAQ